MVTAGPWVAEDGRLRCGGHTPRWRNVLRADPCAYCGGPGGTIDHIVATATEGENALENLTGACPKCNVAKADRPLLSFLLDRADTSDRRRWMPNGTFSGSALALREGLAAIEAKLGC